MEDLVSNNVFVNILSKKLSDEAIQKLFTLHGDIEMPKSMNDAKKLKTEKAFIMKFDSRSSLIRTLAAVHTKLNEIKKDNLLINTLPDDCLAHIFSFLPILERLNIEKVCKRWRIISERGWNDVKEVNLRYIYVDNTIYLILKRCGRYLKKLEISVGPKYVYCLPMVKKFCQLDQLEDIFVSCPGATVTEFELYRRELNEIFGKTQKLIAVTITGNLRYYGIDYLSSLRPEILRKLKVWNLDNRIRDTILINPDRFPNLEELILRNITITEDEMKGHNSLKGLQKMDVGYCRIPKNFIDRLEMFINLTELILEKNFCNIRNEDVRRLTRYCHKITKIVLKGLPEITSNCFQYLGAMPSLEVLEFGKFGNVKSLDIAHLTNVKNLIFHNCDKFDNDQGLIELIISSPNLEEFTLYHVTTLRNTFVGEVREIFERGQRTTPLVLKIEVIDSDQDIVYEWGVLDHRLLHLSILHDYPDADCSD